ncbi:tail fiber protein [Desulfovibrio piger]|uniref:tail fiber protein n=1 Tax=Desulfovibrio piger TaxID=901 RepID=UPI0026F18C7B|nr:tail fiber protein [Desulfovibrio piger]
MHRIDTSTATPDNKFTEGDPAVPVAATTVSAEWLNAVQEELVAVITGAGLELKKSDNGQLWQAIGQLITNAKPGLATKAKPGLVQVGGGLNITPEGILSVLAASVTQAGIVQLASGLSDSTTTAPTCKAVKDAIESKLAAVNVPVGGILAFSGTFGGEGNRFPIPLGEDAPDMHWCLCDGTTTNGLPVPDLRGRMIRGASDSVPAGSTGGSEKHSHSLTGTVGATTLSVEQLASHRHDIKTFPGRIGAANPQQVWEATGDTIRMTENTGGSQPHTHTLDGASGEANNLPPYYALSYIMRIA